MCENVLLFLSLYRVLAVDLVGHPVVRALPASSFPCGSFPIPPRAPGGPEDSLHGDLDYLGQRTHSRGGLRRPVGGTNTVSSTSFLWTQSRSRSGASQCRIGARWNLRQRTTPRSGAFFAPFVRFRKFVGLPTWSATSTRLPLITPAARSVDPHPRWKPAGLGHPRPPDLLHEEAQEVAILDLHL
ncbi:hypothetical protein HPB47_001405 [Ixodes persulcatus]|uniref:Uncharacterized protein n=1 Tax=Ixodes persulcatus TaxID=34615 RepID=A0AC60PP78_IXOPE|nr:hypothetical protein HPB47_001405 [Ixodes persulcatus]